MKVILLLAMCLGLFACGNKNTKGSKAQEQQPPKDHVEVLYFHGKQRCITCAAIEKNTKETVETLFADELKDGSLVFKSIDNLKMKRSSTNTRSRGLHSLSRNGKMARIPPRT